MLWIRESFFHGPLHAGDVSASTCVVEVVPIFRSPVVIDDVEEVPDSDVYRYWFECAEFIDVGELEGMWASTSEMRQNGITLGVEENGHTYFQTYHSMGVKEGDMVDFTFPWMGSFMDALPDPNRG